MSRPVDRIVAKHLEYLGYETHVQPDGWIYAVHPVRHNMHLRASELGVRLHCLIWIDLAILRTAPREEQAKVESDEGKQEDRAVVH